MAMASKQQQPAAVTDKPLSLAEQALQHSVYFNASTCEIKGDVVQLAVVWVSTSHTCRVVGTVQHCHCSTVLLDAHAVYSLSNLLLLAEPIFVYCCMCYAEVWPWASKQGVSSAERVVPVVLCMQQVSQATSQHP